MLRQMVEACLVTMNCKTTAHPDLDSSKGGVCKGKKYTVFRVACLLTEVVHVSLGQQPGTQFCGLLWNADPTAHHVSNQPRTDLEVANLEPT